MSLDLNKVVRLLAAGNIPSPRLEARILLEHVGGSPFAEVDGEAEQKLRRLVERRRMSRWTNCLAVVNFTKTTLSSAKTCLPRVRIPKSWSRLLSDLSAETA